MKRKDNPSTNGTTVSPDQMGSSVASNEKTRTNQARQEQNNLVLWKQPLTTIEYATREIFILLTTYGKKYVFIILNVWLYQSLKFLKF